MLETTHSVNVGHPGELCLSQITRALLRPFSSQREFPVSTSDRPRSLADYTTVHTGMTLLVTPSSNTRAPSAGVTTSTETWRTPLVVIVRILITTLPVLLYTSCILNGELKECGDIIGILLYTI